MRVLVNVVYKVIAYVGVSRVWSIFLVITLQVFFVTSCRQSRDGTKTEQQSDILYYTLLLYTIWHMCCGHMGHVMLVKSLALIPYVKNMKNKYSSHYFFCIPVCFPHVSPAWLIEHIVWSPIKVFIENRYLICKTGIM